MRLLLVSLLLSLAIQISSEGQKSTGSIQKINGVTMSANWGDGISISNNKTTKNIKVKGLSSNISYSNLYIAVCSMDYLNILSNNGLDSSVLFSIKRDSGLFYDSYFINDYELLVAQEKAGLLLYEITDQGITKKEKVLNQDTRHVLIYNQRAYIESPNEIACLVLEKDKYIKKYSYVVSPGEYTKSGAYSNIIVTGNRIFTMLDVYYLFDQDLNVIDKKDFTRLMKKYRGQYEGQDPVYVNNQIIVPFAKGTVYLEVKNDEILAN
jgi:hypothetical protein